MEKDALETQRDFVEAKIDALASLPTLTHKQQVRRAEVAVLELLQARLSDVNPLNRVHFNDGSKPWGEGPTYFSTEIHVPVGPTNETSDAAIETLDDALGTARHIFVNFRIAPEVLVVRHEAELFARHWIRMDIEPPLDPDEF